MKNYTDIIILADRSGSMSTIQRDMEGSFKTFVEKQKKVAGDVKVSVYYFNGRVTEGFVAKDLKEVEGLRIDPSGSTALYDAMAYVIDKTGERLNLLLENDKPNKVLIAVITDGQENASKEFTADQVKEKVKHQTEKYNWSFAFLGANIDSFSVGARIGASIEATMNYMANSKGVANAWRGLCCSTSSYRCSAPETAFAFVDHDSSVK